MKFGDGYYTAQYCDVMGDYTVGFFKTQDRFISHYYN